MPSDNELELFVEVDVAKGNASIKTLNTGLSSIEQAASKAARGASSENGGPRCPSGRCGLALAKAHGIAAGALAESVEAVRKVGYHGDEAASRIWNCRMAWGSPRSLNAAIENIEASEALEKLL